MSEDWVAGLKPSGYRIKSEERHLRRVPSTEELYDVPRSGPPQKAGPTQRRLGPGVAVFGEREGADALAVDGENGVADSWENRGQGGFAEAGRRIIGFQEMNFDFSGDLIHSNGRIFVEIALDGAARVDRDFVGHDGT